MPAQPLRPEEAELLARVDGRKQELIDLLRDLVRIDSRNYSEFRYSDRHQIFAFVERYMKDKAFATARYEAPFPHDRPGLTYPNLIASVSGSSGGRTLQFCGHLDVVAWSEEHWNPEAPPLGGVVKNGRLYGRGAGDMKAGVACQMMAMRLFREAGLPFRGRLQMWFTPDEETHGAYGSAYMTRHHRDAVAADATIISESSAEPPLSSPVFGVGEKGVTWLRLAFQGASGHGSRPKPRSNPINKAARFIAGIRGLRFPRVKPPLGPLALARSVLQRYRARDVRQLLRGDRTARSAHDEDGLSLASLFRTTHSLGTIQAGTMVNVIPECCSVELDVRTLPGITTKHVLDSVADYCARLGYRVRLPKPYANPHAGDRRLERRPVDVEVSILTCGEGSFSSPDTEFGRLLTDSFEAVYRVRAAHFLAFGFSDAGNMRNAGINDIFLFGPRGGGFHAANEYVEVDSLVDATKLYLLAARRYLCGGPERQEG